MTSLVNTAFQCDVPILGPLWDDLLAGPANTQSTAARLPGIVNRVTSAVANGSFILPSILSGEASSPLVVVINDSANTIKVFTASGENMNGSLNGSQSIAAAATGVFKRVPLILPQPQAALPAGPDWRANSIT